MDRTPRSGAHPALLPIRCYDVARDAEIGGFPYLFAFSCALTRADARTNMMGRESVCGLCRTFSHGTAPSSHAGTIESPCTAIVFASNGLVAGPLATEPSSLNRLP